MEKVSTPDRSLNSEVGRLKTKIIALLQNDHDTATLHAVHDLLSEMATAHRKAVRQVAEFFQATGIGKILDGEDDLSTRNFRSGALAQNPLEVDAALLNDLLDNNTPLLNATPQRGGKIVRIRSSSGNQYLVHTGTTAKEVPYFELLTQEQLAADEHMLKQAARAITTRNALKTV